MSSLEDSLQVTLIFVKHSLGALENHVFSACSPHGLESAFSVVEAHDGAPASLSLLPFPPSVLTHLGAPGYPPHPAVHRRAIFVGSTGLAHIWFTFKVNAVDTVQRWRHKGPKLVQAWDGRAGVR